MAAVSDGIQVNSGSLREAVAASLNRGPEPQAALQTPVVPEPVLEPASPVVTEPVPAEPAPAQQTDQSVQTDPVIEDFELDLDKNPLDESAPAEPASAESDQPQLSRKEFDEEFREVFKQHPRFRQIVANHAEIAKLAAPPDQGGIGFRPDADQIKGWHRSHSTMDQMMMDFTSGDPGSVKNFVNFWFGKDAQGRALDGVDQIAEKLPVMLAESNPEAYQKIGTHFGSAIIEQLSGMASSGRYPEADAARLADAALLLGAVTGIKPASGTQPQQPQATAPNDEVAALRARVRELETGRSQQTGEQIRTTVTQNLDRVIAADADKALAPLKEQYKSDPLMFEALRERMVKEMRQTAMSNPVIRGEISKAITRMERAGAIEGMDGMIRLWRQGYADSVPQARTRYLKAAGLQLVSKADESRTILQQAQGKTAPNQGSAPSQSVPLPERQPGESRDEFLRRSIRSRLTVR